MFLPAVFMETVLYNSALSTHGQIFYYKYYETKMDWDADLTLKTYLLLLINLPDHASYSDVSFINVLRPRIFQCQ